MSQDNNEIRVHAGALFGCVLGLLTYVELAVFGDANMRSAALVAAGLAAAHVGAGWVTGPALLGGSRARGLIRASLFGVATSGLAAVLLIAAFAVGLVGSLTPEPIHTLFAAVVVSVTTSLLMLLNMAWIFLAVSAVSGAMFFLAHPRGWRR